MSKPLFNEDDEDVDERIQVNKSFAKAYTSRKQKEELRNSRHDDDDDESSSSDESEDEHADLLTTSLDVNILKTIQALRTKDESIYDPKKEFFPHKMTDEGDSDKKEERHVKKRFKDVIREQILDQMDQEENGNHVDKDNDQRKHRLEYDKEQSDLKKAFLESTNDDDGDEHEDDLIVVKSRVKPTDEEEKLLEKEYEALEKSKPVVSNISDPRGEVADGEQFLLDFLKNKKWMDKDEGEEYHEPPPAESDEESLEQLDKTDDFESTYNFRFEQAEAAAKSGAEFSVVPYARAGSMTTLRRKDDTRKLKRETRKERKAAERKAKEEQLKRLKNAKREEMEERLSEIKKVIGVASNLDEDAMLKLMEGDFDPEKFEKIMQEQYGDDFYQEEDPQWKSDLDVRNALLQDDDGKALVGDDDLEGGMYDESLEYDENGDANADAEDDDGYLEDDEHVEEETSMERKLKEKMDDELYKLDYEDIVAGMPTRFKYRKVEPNDYGLTTQEILFARDSTLKNFVSLKKMAPYKDDGEHLVGSKKRRKFREMLKADLEEAMEEEGVHQEHEDVETEVSVVKPLGDKKKRRQKKGKKKAMQEIDDNAALVTDVTPFEISNQEVDTLSDSFIEAKRLKKKDKNVQMQIESFLEHGSEIEEPFAPFEIPSSLEKVDEKASKKKEKKRKQKDANGGQKKRNKNRKFALEGIPESRLGAFGL